MIYNREFPEVLILEDRITEVINTKNFLWFSRTIVETGTCNGAGIDRFLTAGYTDIRSVEMSDNWYSYSSSRFSSNPHIKIWHGDSREKLAEMLPDNPAVVILDAHPAGPGTAGHDDLIKFESEGTPHLSNFHGDKILEAEIQILKNSKHKHLIIIDDQHSVNPLWVEMLSDYDHEHVNKKYLVFIPKNINGE
jgi:hypothetical protein